MKKNTKKISVIIPVFNTGKYLEKCLQSVLNQTFTNIEILCVYKKSIDNSKDILNKYKNKIRMINQTEGKLGEARNIGIRNATGEYAFFLDSDDWIKKNAIEKLLRKIEKDKTDVVIFPFYSYDNVSKKIKKNAWGSKIKIRKKIIKSPFNFKDLKPHEVISENSLVVAWNKLYKLSFLKENNILFPKNLRFEDNPFYYEMLFKAKSISFLNTKLLFYRVNREESLQSSNYDSLSTLEIIKIFMIIEKIFKENSSNENLYDYFEKYMINEFTWRYNLMKINRLNFIKEIKKSCNEKQFNLFLEKINWNKNIQKNLNNFEKIIVSVIIPVYNVEKYISECINSIINQTLKNIEIIFIDDCCSDNSLKIIENYAYYDERIKIIYNKENKGAGYSRNEGLKIALGKYIMFMDPDDFYSKNDVIEKMYKNIEKSNLNVCCGNIGVVKENFKINDSIIQYRGFNVEERKVYNVKDYKPFPTWGFTRFIFNLSFLQKNEIVFPNYRYYEDPVFLGKVLLKCEKFYGVNEIIYLYRQVPKKRDLTFNMIMDTLSSIEELFLMYDNKKDFASNYIFEYNHLLDYTYESIMPYIKKKKEKFDLIQEKLNKLLNNLNTKTLEKFNVIIYHSLKEIPQKKKKNIIKRIINKISFVLKNRKKQ